MPKVATVFPMVPLQAPMAQCIRPQHQRRRILTPHNLALTKEAIAFSISNSNDALHRQPSSIPHLQTLKKKPSFATFPLSMALTWTSLISS